MKKKRRCCICGKVMVEYGNNPYPVKTEGYCCNVCKKEIDNANRRTTSEHR